MRHTDDPWNDAYFGEFFPAFPDDCDIPPVRRHRHRASHPERLPLVIRVTTVLTIVAAAVLCILFAGCSTPKVVTPVLLPDTTCTSVHIAHATDLRRDSIFIHDSIYIREVVRGDTVRIETVRWHIRDVDRLVEIHDTVRDIDTIRIEIPVQVPGDPVIVEKKPGKFGLFLAWTGGILWIAAIAYAAIKLSKVNLRTLFSRIIRKLTK